MTNTFYERAQKTIFTYEIYGTPLPGHTQFIDRYGTSDGDTMNRLAHPELGQSITAYEDTKGGTVIIYPDTIVPEGARLITADQFHGRA